MFKCILCKCTLCSTTKERANDLDAHMALTHKTELTLSCTHCNFETLGRPEVARHYGRSHLSHRGEAKYLIFKLASLHYLEKKKDEKRRKEKLQKTSERNEKMMSRQTSSTSFISVDSAYRGDRQNQTQNMSLDFYPELAQERFIFSEI